MTFWTDDELRKILAEEGLSPDAVEEALQARNDLFTVDQVRSMAAPEGHDTDDIDGAIATIVEEGTTLPPISGKRSFTQDDYVRVLNEIIKRKMRRLHQDHTLVALSEARSNHLASRIEHPLDQGIIAAAKEELDIAVKRALRHGAHIDDISTASSLRAQEIRTIRDAQL
ncbi:hypothetical protein M2405_004321 [Rhodococcus erythropolis]|uniref:hypothetical protein n=1 Tax=Rhodococcus erythropolis TaxID=1833 RepID=UPI002169EA31|nr:hypothetical protein [Rhodococcus erythropolis]MCS4256018.1 hypothetical protein [Rhodococcus erythropolis]MCW2425536.1 hypothetical protein [Rhodococcus erythropolis]